MPAFIEQVLYLYDLFHNIFDIKPRLPVWLTDLYAICIFVATNSLKVSLKCCVCVCVWTDVWNTGFNLVLSYEMFSGSHYPMQQTVCVSSNLKAFLKARDVLIWTTLPRQKPYLHLTNLLNMWRAPPANMKANGAQRAATNRQSNPPIIKCGLQNAL